MAQNKKRLAPVAPKYPGTKEAEAERNKARTRLARIDDEEPDFINGAPNYDKFKSWDTERVLSWLNID